MNKPKELIAYEAHQIFVGKSYLLPSLEHIEYLGTIITEHKGALDAWINDAKAGSGKVVEYYSQAF